MILGAMLYKYDTEGHATDTVIATVSIADDGAIQIHMVDGSLIFRMSLEQMGYFLLWSGMGPGPLSQRGYR